MDAFTKLTGIAAPLPMANVDTDKIIPARLLKTIQRTGLGKAAFANLRYREDGSENPDFVLNQPRYQGASILLARKNFGCGSSREHAPWALQQYGFRAIIAPSFADIFFNNCYKSGLLPIVLSEQQVDQLFNDVKAFPGFKLVVDLEKRVVATPDGHLAFEFAIDDFRKYCLLNGLDDIGLTLRHADDIRAFEERHLAAQPWLANTI